MPQIWYPITNVLTRSKIKVNETQAMRIATVLACVRLLAETVGSLPMHVYRREGDARHKDREHPLYKLLHQRPNRWQTAVEYYGMMQMHLSLRGNAFAQLVLDPDTGEPAELIPIHPDRVKVERVDADQSLVYKVAHPVTRAEHKVPAEMMHHIRGLSGDGVMGMSPIQQAAEAMGITLAAERLSASFFRNNAILGAAFEHPGNLSKDAAKRLKESMQDEYSGADAAYQIHVLEEGMKWQQIGVKPEEGQFLQTRKFQAVELARIFRVPPHMVGILDKATYNNIEHQGIDFVTHTIRPICVRHEQAIQRDLLLDDETHYAKFLVDALLRGDSIRRAQAMKIQFMHGALNQDEWREAEDRNPIPGGAGKKFYVPLNMVEGKGGSGGDNEAQDDRDLKGSRAILAWVESLVSKIVAAELRALERWSSKAAHSTTFDKWCANFWTKHSLYVMDTLKPVFVVLDKRDSLSRVTNEIITAAERAYAGLGPSDMRIETQSGRHRQITDIIAANLSEVQDEISV
jgi:HK97 family phage portal protein